MPPRYAYWTILIDNQATAFRAREREELLPTLAQLRRTNADVVMKWFARGRIWESREAEIAAQQQRKERRGPDWRPGGNHQDPRDRFRKQPGSRPRAAQRPTGSPEAAKPPHGEGQSAPLGARRLGRGRRPFRSGKGEQTSRQDSPARRDNRPRKADWRRRS